MKGYTSLSEKLDPEDVYFLEAVGETTLAELAFLPPDRLEAAVRAEVDAAVEFARASPHPEAADAFGRLPTAQGFYNRGNAFMKAFDYGKAIAAYERALQAIEDPAQATPIKCKIGESYVLIGDARALDYLEEAKATLDPETQPAEVARATMIEARFHHYLGQSAKAAELLPQLYGFLR